MKQILADNIVEFLSFSGSRDSLLALKRVSHRDWERVLLWLDDTGLAFYFLQKLKDTNSADVMPTALFSRLETNFAANQGRVEDMSRRFDALNRRFNEAGIGYVVLKGLSLIPEFCPNAPLRHQGDFDYLVEAQSLSAAHRVLIEAGYAPKDSPSDQEFGFVLPGAAAPSRTGRQYSADAPHAVELHLDVWHGNLSRLPSPKLFAVERAKLHEWNGITFPALTDDDAFLLQVVHACQHLFAQWVRMACFLEIAYFLKRRGHDTALWSRIEQRVDDRLMLREFVVLVCELAAKLFACPLPPVVRAWGARMRPGPRIWIEKYARLYAFCELPAYQFDLFPRSKLVLFLQNQYEADTTVGKAVDLKGALLPLSRVSQIASSVRRKPSLVLNARYWKHQRVVRRSIFHALAGLRYLSEIPRWLWRTRARVRSASLYP